MYDTILAKSPFIIYKPGVASSGLAVQTWTEVQSFIALRQGTVIVFVDDSVTSPAPVPGGSGITDCGGRVELRSALTDSLGTSVLVIQDGATLRDLSIIRGVEVQCDTRGATPALDFTSTDGGNLLVKDFGTLSNAATATNPAIVVAATKTVFLNMEEGALVLNAPAVPLFSVLATGLLQMWALDGTSLSGANPGFASGAGDVELNYDNSSATFFGVAGVPVPPPLPGITGTYTTTNTDNVWQSKPIEKASFDAPADFNVPVFHAVPGAGSWKAQAGSTSLSFLASTNDVLNALQVAGLLPTTGIIPITISGCGGGGGGGGGQGGAGGNGAGAGGGALYHEVTFDFDLSHRLDIVIGAGGTPGAGGAAGLGAGTRGGDGLPTYALDFTTNTVLGSLHAGSGGGPNQAAGGRGGASYPGEALYAAPSPNPALVPQHAGGLPFSSGFPASGGQAAAGPGVVGFQGQFGLNSIGVPAGVTMWAGGAGGGAGAGAGAAGGGGGPGPFGNGGAGGTPTAAGPTGAGASPAANTGAGAGGGAGGNTGADTGGAGGTGGSGQARLRLMLI